MIVDCEGAEVSLLNQSAIPELRRCDLVVECHDFIDRSITDTLRLAFSATHEVINILEGARNPNEFPMLRKLGSLYRWLAVNENRPEMMNWLVCWARQ